MKKPELLLIPVVSFIIGIGLGAGAMLGRSSAAQVTTNDGVWTFIGDTNNGAEWRVTDDQDSTSVVHIYHNGKLATWVGEPCNCY
jgi:hypothetical protein